MSDLFRPGPVTSVGDVPMHRLHTVFDSMFDGVWMVTPTGITTYTNDAMAAMLGMSRPELQGRHFTEFLDQVSWPAAEAFLGRQPSAPGERIELPFRRHDGRELVGLVAASPITSEDGAFVGTMLNFSDVTRKRDFEAQVAQNEKMQAIGEFAGGLAHDFNNLLTAIRGHAELAHASTVEGSSIRADLDQVMLSADRASAITRKLLAFTRRQVLEPILLDPGRLVGDLMPMLSTLLGNDIDAILRVEPAHQWVRIDPGQFEQVIVNLVVNARDAMPGGGTVTLSVGDIEQPRLERPDELEAPRLAVRISVADTGHGMDERVKSRVFDPFFTTKPFGKGTGLGLATVFGIVTQSGGRIEVQSAIGEGSTFKVDLPGFPAPSADAGGAGADDTTKQTNGVVLVVEDEASVRDFARRALEASGFTVLSAGSGKEAIRASRRWVEQIDVLLTDVVMDGMQGPDVVHVLRGQRPDVGVIYMSGYAADILDRSDPGAYDAFIPKPFSAATLTAAVARVLVAIRLERGATVNDAPTSVVTRLLMVDAVETE